VPKLSYSNIFQGIALNNFTRCNARCVYCSIWENNTECYYHVLPILKRFEEEGLLHENVVVDWGGGEPLIYPEFDDIFNWCLENKIKQHINSSGLTFSENVFKGLKGDLVLLQISPDSGTKEVYSKIKGLNGFERVWLHIGKYCEYADNVTIKFIIFSLNNDEKQIWAFVEKCFQSGVKNIEISCEWRTIWDYDTNWQYGKLSKEDFEAAKLLKTLAESYGIKVTISSIWSQRNTEFIKTTVPYYETCGTSLVDEKVTHINYNIIHINNRLNDTDNRLNAIDNRLNAIDNRLNAIDTKLDDLAYMLEKIDYPERLLRKVKGKK
jgi:molybdenum cofactor biosynthesis enzyme MoaA